MRTARGGKWRREHESASTAEREKTEKNANGEEKNEDTRGARGGEG